jgi:DNA polymerase III delta subunit
LTLSTEEILALVERYEKQSRAIKEELLRLCWYMRGGLSYNEAMMLSASDKKVISKIINDNLEIAKKSGLPFF